MVLTQEGKDFIDKWALLFADNEFENITEETFRTFANDAAQLREKGQYRAVQLAGPGFTAQAILGSEAIEPWILYAIKGTPDPTDPTGLAGTWNQTGTEEIVYVPGLFPHVFASTGWMLGPGNTTMLVEVDIAAGTYQAVGTGTNNAIPLTGTAAGKAVSGPVVFADNVGIRFTSGGGDFDLYGDGGQLSIVSVATGNLVALINDDGIEVVDGSLKLSTTGNSPVSMELSVNAASGDLLINGLPLGSSQTIAIGGAQSTDYTLAASDLGTIVLMAAASNTTLTIPRSSSTPLKVNGAVQIRNRGTGTVTVAFHSSITVISESSGYKIPPNAEAGLHQEATDVWFMTGGRA